MGLQLGLLIVLLAMAGLAYVASQPKASSGGDSLQRWVQQHQMETFWIIVGGALLIAGSLVGSEYLVEVGIAIIVMALFGGAIFRLLERVLQALDGLFQSVGSAMAAVVGRLTRRLGAVGGVLSAAGAAGRWLSGFVGKFRSGVGRMQLLVDRLRPPVPPKLRPALRATSGALFVGAAALSVGMLLKGGGSDAAAPGAIRPGGAAGGAAPVDMAWLEALAREWFTYDGLDSWLGRLEPYLAPGATQALRRCVQEPPGAPIWRVMRTSILEGPRVEVLGPLKDLTYGAIADRGGAVHHPGIRERYGVDLQPDDLGVRFTATIAREFAPEKMQLPGIEQLTRARVAVQFFIAGGRAVPDYGECGMGVAWV